MTEDEEFLKDIATKAAKVLHMPLGDIDPAKLLEMYSCLWVLFGNDEELMRHWLNQHNKHLEFCPGAYLTSEYHMNKILGYLQGMVEH